MSADIVSLIDDYHSEYIKFLVEGFRGLRDFVTKRFNKGRAYDILSMAWEPFVST